MPPLHPTTVVAFAPLAVVAVGLGSLLRARRHITEQLLFAAEYRKHLHVLLEQRDGQAYEWLTVNANRMQSHMGSAGFLTMRPPHASYMVSNYAIVLNGLAEIRKYLSDSYLSGTDLPAQYGALIDDALLRHHGTLAERRRFNSGSLKNPFTWLAVGTQKLLAAPLWLLASLGVLSREVASRVASSSAFRVLSGVAATVGFVSAVVGLVTGWEQFIVIARSVVAGAF
jgi:hypothetical protein